MAFDLQNLPEAFLLRQLKFMDYNDIVQLCQNDQRFYSICNISLGKRYIAERRSLELKRRFIARIDDILNKMKHTNTPSLIHYFEFSPFDAEHEKLYAEGLKDIIAQYPEHFQYLADRESYFGNKYFGTTAQEINYNLPPAEFVDKLFNRMNSYLSRNRRGTVTELRNFLEETDDPRVQTELEQLERDIDKQILINHPNIIQLIEEQVDRDVIHFKNGNYAASRDEHETLSDRLAHLER